MSKAPSEHKRNGPPKFIAAVIYYVVSALLWALRLLPFRALAYLGRIGGAIAYALDGRHRRVAQKNLRDSFRDEYSEKEIRGFALENFKRLGEVFASSAKLHYLNEDQLRQVLTVNLDPKSKRPSPLLCQPENGLNASLFAIGHFGNFEAYAWVGKLFKWKKFATTYRALPEPRLNSLIQKGRHLSGCEFLERRSDGDEVKKRLRDPGCFFGLLADQRMANGGVQCNFFGRECLTSAAPAIFALRYDRPLRVGICFRTGLGRWTITFFEAVRLYRLDGKRRSPKAITQDINDQFELAIRLDPANWFWVHNRWKNPGVDRDRKRNQLY